MKKKQKYRTPVVLEKIPVCLENPILSGSVVDTTGIKTTGQEKEGFYDNSSSTTFNHTWGE